MRRAISLGLISLLLPLLAGGEGKETESAESLALWRARLEEAARPDSPYHSYMSQGWLSGAAHRLSPEDVATAAELTLASMKGSAGNIDTLAMLTMWLFALEDRVPAKVAEEALNLLWEKFVGASGDDRTLLALRALRIGNSPPLAKDSCGFTPQRAEDLLRVVEPMILFNLKDGNLEVGLGVFRMSKPCLTPEQVSRVADAMRFRIQKEPATLDQVKPYLDSLGPSGNEDQGR